MSQVGLAALLVFIGVWCAVYIYRRIAIKKAWFDIPNQRSSHVQPTPGGAGIALALVLLPLQYLLLSELQQPSSSLMTRLACVGGIAGALACVGWFDDRFGLPAAFRASVFLLAALAVALLVLAPDWGWVVIATAGVFMYINFFNFMDGSDGIAALECLFVAIGLMLFSAGDSTIFPLSATLAAGCAAFLVWNWAPAKVFMGDAGSLFCGFYLAALALIAHAQGVVHISVSLMLGILFIAEPLTVLILRALAGDNITQAHRSHVYQLLALRWSDHRRVALSYLAVNCAVVLPLAFCVRAKSTEGTIITVFAYILSCLIVGILRHRLLLSSADKI